MIAVANSKIKTDETTKLRTYGGEFYRNYNTGDSKDYVINDGSTLKLQWVYGYLKNGSPTTIDSSKIMSGTAFISLTKMSLACYSLLSALVLSIVFMANIFWN